MTCEVAYGLNIVIKVVIYKSYKDAWLNVVRDKLSRLSPIGLVFCQLSFNAVDFVVWNGVPKVTQPGYKIYRFTFFSQRYQVVCVFQVSSYQNLRYKQGLVQVS